MAETFCFLWTDAFDRAKRGEVARCGVGDLAENAVVENDEGSPLQFTGKFEPGGSEFLKTLGSFAGEFAEFGGRFLLARAAGTW